MPDETKNTEPPESDISDEAVKRECETGNAEAPPSGSRPGRPSKKPPPVLSPADGGNNPAPPVNNGKRRVKCGALKGRMVVVGKGKIVPIDENGFLEVGAEEAERLLTIPGYTEE